MATYARQSKESRRRLALAAGGTQPLHAAQAARIRDHRPEASLYDRVQAEALTSQRAQQIGAAQRMADAAPPRHSPAVMQLVTPLRRDMLNVVGEDHPESEARLDLEKRYAKTYSGSSNYWIEGQFRVRASTVMDWVNDRRPFADPFQLRFNQTQRFLADNAVAIKGDGDANLTTDGARRNLEVQEKFIHNLWTYLENLSSEGFFKAQEDGYELSPAARTTMLALRPQVKNIAVTWQAARVALASAAGQPRPPVVFSWATGGTEVTSEAHKRADFKKSVDDLGQLNVVTDTRAQISSNRSDAMHTAANARAAEHGVWKIGDSHATDMQAKGDRRYNLVSQATFNADYATWHP